MNELKKAYQLVTQDLFNRLIKAKDGESIQIGSLGALGSLKKTEHQQKCGWDGNTYAFYKVSFSMSKKVRNELTKSLERKYR